MASAHFFPFSSNGGIWRRRRVQIVFGRLTVHVSAKPKTEKTRHHQQGSGYHQPMRIFHLGEHVISPSPLAAAHLDPPRGVFRLRPWPRTGQLDLEHASPPPD